MLRAVLFFICFALTYLLAIVSPPLILCAKFIHVIQSRAFICIIITLFCLLNTISKHALEFNNFIIYNKKQSGGAVTPAAF